MRDSRTRLRKRLKKIARRASAVRYLRLSGLALFLFSVVLFLLVLSRALIRRSFDTEILPVDPIWLAPISAAAVLLMLLLLRAAMLLRPPRSEAIARHADQKLGLEDLLASGLAAIDMDGEFPREVVRRAAAKAEDIDADRLYPARRSILRTLAVLPLVLAAVYFVGLSSGRGMIPMSVILPGAPDLSAESGAGPEEPGGEEEKGETEPENEPDRPEGQEPAVPDEILVKLTPSKKTYTRNEPITLFVTAVAGEPMAAEHTLALILAVDEEPEDLGESMTVKPGPQGGALHIVVDAKLLTGSGPRFTPGKHVLAAALVENGRVFASEPVEIEIEGDPGGAPKPEPKPEPEPAGGAEPPPPQIDTLPRFVDPLAREGETEEKKGWALVPDPKAPPGSPPRRLPRDEAAREAGRRTETSVPLERVRPEDRETVSKYFDLLRSGR